MKHPLLASILVLAAACGSKSKGPDGAGGGGDGPSFSGPLPPGEWEALDHKGKGKFMNQVVLPEMKQRFQAFDAEEFAEFECATCHGSGAAAGDFEMPNPELPGLTGDMIMNPDEDHAAITEFMKAEVRPIMANLLGMKEWSPQAPDGFGCMHCHPAKP